MFLRIQSAAPTRTNEHAVRVALLTGDIEAEQEAVLVEQEGADALKADLLLVPHHGSKTSSTQVFRGCSASPVGHTNWAAQSICHPHPVCSNGTQRLGLSSVATPQCGASCGAVKLPMSPTASVWRKQAPAPMAGEGALISRAQAAWRPGILSMRLPSMSTTTPCASLPIQQRRWFEAVDPTAASPCQPRCCICHGLRLAGFLNSNGRSFNSGTGSNHQSAMIQSSR